MEIHFFSTGPDFPYSYYLSIMSAIKTQSVQKINLYVTTPQQDRYLDLLSDRINIIDVQPGREPKTTSLFNNAWAEKVRRTHYKDLLAWQVLYDKGGILLDLDTFCLKDLSTLLTEKEVVASPYRSLYFTPTLYPFNNAVVIARPHSIIIKDALDNTIDALALPIEAEFLWGTTGPIALSNAIQKYYHLVEFIPPCTIDAGNLQDDAVMTVWRDSGTVEDYTRVIHLYASTHLEQMARINVDFIASSNILYARLVKKILSPAEWNI